MTCDRQLDAQAVQKERREERDGKGKKADEDERNGSKKRYVNAKKRGRWQGIEEGRQDVQKKVREY